MMPLNQILKNPGEPKWRNVDTQTFFLKKITDMNSEALGSLFSELGFTKVSDKTFKFQTSQQQESSMITVTPEESPKTLGNLKVLAQAVSVFT